MEHPKRKIALKMKIPEVILLRLAKVGGRVGEAAATLDSWQNRHYYKGKGVYK